MSIQATLTQGEFDNIPTLTRTLRDKFGRARKGRFMHTASGDKWYPFDVRADEVSIETIAHQLAGQNRWQGAVQHPQHVERIFYSVAEHSVYCSYAVPQSMALEALLHDASEAYIGDLIRPLKYDDSFRAPFKVVEVAHERAIAERFGLVYPFPAPIKRADEAVCTAEERQIVVKSPDEDWDSVKYHDDRVAADFTIQMLGPYEAKRLFLSRFHELYDLTREARR